MIIYLLIFFIFLFFFFIGRYFFHGVSQDNSYKKDHLKEIFLFKELQNIKKKSWIICAYDHPYFRRTECVTYHNIVYLQWEFCTCLLIYDKSIYLWLKIGVVHYSFIYSALAHRHIHKHTQSYISVKLRRALTCTFIPHAFSFPSKRFICLWTNEFGLTVYSVYVKYLLII